MFLLADADREQNRCADVVVILLAICVHTIPRLHRESVENRSESHSGLRCDGRRTTRLEMSRQSSVLRHGPFIIDLAAAGPIVAALSGINTVAFQTGLVAMVFGATLLLSIPPVSLLSRRSLALHGEIISIEFLTQSSNRIRYVSRSFLKPADSYRC